MVAEVVQRRWRPGGGPGRARGGLPRVPHGAFARQYHARWLVMVPAAILAVAAGVAIASGMPTVAAAMAVGIPVAAVLVRYPFAAVLLWVLCTPYFVEVETATPSPVFWLLHRLMIPGILALVVVYRSLGVWRGRFRITAVDVAMLVFLVLAVANIVLLGSNPSRMLVAFYDRIGVPLLMFWLVRLLDPGRNDFQRLAIAGLVTVLIQTAIGILSWAAPDILPNAWLGRAGERTVGTFGGPGPYTATIVFFALLALQYGLTRAGHRRRSLIVLAVGLGCLAIFLSLSRGSWLGAGLAFAGVATLYPGPMVRLAIAGVAVVVALGLGPLSDMLAHAEERLGDEVTAAARIVTNDAAVRMIAARPVSGFGYGNFERYDEQYKRRVGSIPLTEGGSSHNSYLALAAENGIPGLVLYLAPAAGLLARTLSLRRRLPTSGFLGRGAVALLWLALLDQFVVSNFTDVLHSSSWGVTLWWLGLGLIAVLLDRARPVDRWAGPARAGPARAGPVRAGPVRP